MKLSSRCLCTPLAERDFWSTRWLDLDCRWTQRQKVVIHQDCTFSGRSFYTACTITVDSGVFKTSFLIAEFLVARLFQWFQINVCPITALRTELLGWDWLAAGSFLHSRTVVAPAVISVMLLCYLLIGTEVWTFPQEPQITYIKWSNSNLTLNNVVLRNDLSDSSVLWHFTCFVGWTNTAAANAVYLSNLYP